MSLSAKQQFYLQEMGINLWQRKTEVVKDLEYSEDKDSENQIISKENNIVSKQPSLAPIAIEQLQTSIAFQDILLALSIDPADITVKNNVIACGQVHWQFSPDSEHISIENNRLTTPVIEALKISPRLKAKLWQQLQQL